MPKPWADIAASADAALFAQFGEAVSVGLRSAGVYNPLTGTTSSAVYTAYATTAIIGDLTRLTLRQPSGGEARAVDFRAQILAVGLPRAIAQGDRITWAGKTIEVVSADQELYGGALYCQHVDGRTV